MPPTSKRKQNAPDVLIVFPQDCFVNQYNPECDGKSAVRIRARFRGYFKQTINREYEETIMSDPIINTTTFNETSNSGPSAVFFQGAWYLSWRGGDDSINVIQTAVSTGQMTKMTSQQKTIADPSLFTDGNNLFVCWTGTDNGLNLGQIEGFPVVPS